MKNKEAKILKELKKWLKKEIKEDKKFVNMAMESKDEGRQRSCKAYLMSDKIFANKIKELEKEHDD